jgi:hypothetical protein
VIAMVARRVGAIRCGPRRLGAHLVVIGALGGGETAMLASIASIGITAALAPSDGTMARDPCGVLQRPEP